MMKFGQSMVKNLRFNKSASQPSMMMQTAYAPMSARAAVKRNDTFMVRAYSRTQGSEFDS